MKFKPAPRIPESGRLKTIATGTAEVFKLDPRTLSRSPQFNTRYDFGDIAALAADIEANGILEALKVRKEGTQVLIVNGDRRLTAIELLIKENRWPADPARPGFPMPIPCTSEGKGISPTDRIFMMLSLNTGKPFNLLEKGYAYVRILDADPTISAAEVARRTGETRQAVSMAVSLIRKASPGLIALIKDGTISPTTAFDLTKSHADHSAQDQAAAAAIATAATNGRSHATPKDLSQKPAPPATEKSTPAASDPSDPSDPSHPSHLSPESHSSHPCSSPPAKPDAPSNPAAFERLKSAPSTNRDGSAGGPGGGFASCDKRLKHVEELLDEMDPTVVHQDRWNTVELILDYLNGNHTIALLRTHLTDSAP